MKLKTASFFTGVGGIELGFSNEIFEMVYANEYDKYAVMTFEENFSTKVDSRDIRDVSVNDIPDFDVLLAGFPCQPFSIAGYQQGFDDKKDRGNLFFELIRIIENKMPKILFLENVKNLVSHDKGNTFLVITKLLSDLGYHIKYSVLNAKDYGNIPHGRERIYIVGFLDINTYQKFDFPLPIKLTNSVFNYIDFNNNRDKTFLYTPNNCSFYQTLFENMNNPNSIYQWRRIYVRENKSNVCPTLTANMGTGGHNVPLIMQFKDNGDKMIRKLTPRECFNLQGFPSKYMFPNISNTQLYKQAGNSVVVPVIKRIADNIVKACLT
jgi:DNA (cytosine-5)-methyltransferase 1